MLNRYNNFVKSSHNETREPEVQPKLTGEEAKRLYLEEISQDNHPIITKERLKSAYRGQEVKKVSILLDDISKKDLFMCVENNDVHKLVQILDSCPDMLNITDEYGWSLLMIGCQANSVDVVNELMQRGINTSARDKAGNSAHSLVIKNKNLVLADILLKYRKSEPVTPKKRESPKTKTTKTKSKVKKRKQETYTCEICDRDYPDKEEHLSSTVHNISASKDKKIPPNYKIPVTNKGYQIMVRVGWDRESGLGRDGSGNKYPIKTVQKQDKKGLGHDKKRRKSQEKETLEPQSKKLIETKRRKKRNMEINFRRQFY